MPQRRNRRDDDQVVSERRPRRHGADEESKWSPPRGSSTGGGRGGGSGIPRGSSGGSGRSGGSGVPRGSSISGGGRGGGRGIPRGAAIRRGRSGGSSSGVPRGSKSDSALGIEQKADDGARIENIDEKRGIVEAYVSVTGVEDSVNDVIEPGAYEKTLAQRTPKGVWSHAWSEPISKTLAIKEIMPGDESLPKKLSNGDPWPSNAGALWVKTQFNLDSPRGQQAFSDVKFFGDDGSWSIGYKSKRATKGKDGVRHIHDLELYEYSPVLHGANSHAKTLSVKSLDEAIAVLEDGGYDTSALDVDTMKSAAHDGDETAQEYDDEPIGLDAADVKTLVDAYDIIGCYLDEVGVKRSVVHGDPDLEIPDDDDRWIDSASEMDGPMSLAEEIEEGLSRLLGDEFDAEEWDDLLTLADEFDEASDNADEETAGEAMRDLIDVFEAEEAEDPALEQLRAVIADVLDDRWPDADGEIDDEDEFDDDELDGDESDEADDDGSDDLEGSEAESEASGEKSEGSSSERKSPSGTKRDRAAASGAAMTGGKFPIESAEDLRKAIGMRKHGSAPQKIIDAHIVKRARALGLTDQLPDELKPSNDSKTAGDSLESKVLAPMGWASNENADLIMSAIDF